MFKQTRRSVENRVWSQTMQIIESLIQSNFTEDDYPVFRALVVKREIDEWKQQSRKKMENAVEKKNTAKWVAECRIRLQLKKARSDPIRVDWCVNLNQSEAVRVCFKIILLASFFLIFYFSSDNRYFYSILFDNNYQKMKLNCDIIYPTETFYKAKNQFKLIKF